jgi:predicted Zn-dependent protease with MMP-like domain
MREWLQDEDNAAVLTGMGWLATFLLFLASMHFSYWYFVPTLGMWWAMSRISRDWLYFFPSTVTAVPVPEERDDPKAEATLSRAMDRLTSEELDILEHRGIAVQAIHNARPLRDGRTIWAQLTEYGTGLSVIEVFTANMRAYQQQEEMSEAAFEDWMYRILLHEIGHVRGLDDKQMAKEFNY